MLTGKSSWGRTTSEITLRRRSTGKGRKCQLQKRYNFFSSLQWFAWWKMHLFHSHLWPAIAKQYSVCFKIKPAPNPKEWLWVSCWCTQVQARVAELPEMIVPQARKQNLPETLLCFVVQIPDFSFLPLCWFSFCFQSTTIAPSPLSGGFVERVQSFHPMCEFFYASHKLILKREQHVEMCWHRKSWCIKEFLNAKNNVRPFCQVLTMLMKSFCASCQLKCPTRCLSSSSKIPILIKKTSSKPFSPACGCRQLSRALGWSWLRQSWGGKSIFVFSFTFTLNVIYFFPFTLTSIFHFLFHFHVHFYFHFHFRC